MFSEPLQIALELTIANDVHSIPGGNIKNCRISMLETIPPQIP